MTAEYFFDLATERNIASNQVCETSFTLAKVREIFCDFLWSSASAASQSFCFAASNVLEGEEVEVDAETASPSLYNKC